jgi:hypothetical protein
VPTSAYAAKAALDWVFGGATPTRPTQCWMGLSYGSPTSTSGSEIVTPVGTYTRATATFAAAVSPGGSAILGAVVIFPVASYSATVSGWQIWDTQAVGAGNMLLQGLLSAATLPAAASQFTASAAAGVVMSAI